MPSFKPKTTKKIKVNKKSNVTLDGKHNEFINEFTKDEQNNLPKLKNEKGEIMAKIEENEKSSTMTIEELMDYKDRLNEINNEIKSMKSKKKEYFLDNSKYIFDYFENKKNISSGADNSAKSKNKILNSFFKIESNANNVITNQNNNIFQKYLANIDDSFLDINLFLKPSDVCQSCYKGELIPLEDEGIMICNICSRTIPYLIENEKPSYKEPPK